MTMINVIEDGRPGPNESKRLGLLYRALHRSQKTERGTSAAFCDPSVSDCSADYLMFPYTRIHE